MFDQKNQKRIKIVWAVVGIFVAVSMVLVYLPF